MNIFSTLYTELLSRPLLNLLIGITALLPGNNVGWAIIIVTLIVRLILLAPSVQQARHQVNQQEKMKGVQKELADIKKKHKDDAAKQSQETMRVYREAGINPAAGCLPLLIQLPILFALYRVFLTGINAGPNEQLYGFVPVLENINTMFLGISLNDPSLLLGVLAGVGQFFLMRISLKAASAQPSANEETAQMMMSMQKNMQYFFPVMTVFIAMRLPAALSLYWLASTIFALVQQRLIKRWLKTDGPVPAV